MRKPAKFVLLLALLSPVCAMALGLGNIKLNSALNQPLDAEIELISASPAELDSLGIALASADAFASYGLDRPAYLLGMRFRVVRDGSGGAIVRVTTDQPVREPFVTFLIEADWARGRLLREYTVLLDPPVFMTEEPAPAPRTTPAAPATTQPATGAVSREPSAPPPAASPSTGSAVTPAPSRMDAMSTRYGPIRRNETLWTIASRLRPDQSVSVNQMMIALFRENPQAFMGNINRLRQGAVLRVPSNADIYALSSSEAFAEVRRQNAAWRGSRPSSSRASTTAGSGSATSATSQAGPSGRLRLVPPGDAADAQAASQQSNRDAAAADSEIAGSSALNQRIRSLEGELENARRLIDVKDSELSALQARLEALEARVAAETAAAAAAAEGAVTSGTEPETAVISEPDEPEQAATVEPEVQAVDEQPVPPPAVVTPPQEGKGLIASILDFLAGAWLWILGLLVVGLAAAFFFLVRGRSSEGDYSDSWETSEWKATEGRAPEAASVPPAPAPSEPDTESQPVPQFDRDDSFVVVEAEDTITEESLKPTPPADIDDFTAALGDAFEDTGTFTPGELEVEKAEQTETLEEDAADYPFEDTMIGHDALKLDESDPVAEADFHMAYGLYDQAAALVERAIEKDPQSHELKMKLMEIFFVWGNKERFVEQAKAFKSEVGDAGASDWEKVAIMGKQLVPGDEMFVGSDATGVLSPDLEFSLDDEAQSSATTDLDFLGGDDDLVNLDMGVGGDTINEDDGLQTLKEKIESQIEPSEETLDLGSSHVDLDMDLEGDPMDGNNESTAVNEGLPGEDVLTPEAAATTASGLDEDLEIDLDFRFEDVDDDEPTAVLDDVDAEDIASMLADADDDDSATRIQDMSALDDDESATRIQKISASDDAAEDDSATRIQDMASWDDDDDDDESATRIQKISPEDMQDDDESATRMQDMTGFAAPGDDDTRITHTSEFESPGDSEDLTMKTTRVASDEHGGTMQMPSIDLGDAADDGSDESDDDATRQVSSLSGVFGGDETVQLSRGDVPADDDRTVQVNYGDGDLTTQLHSGAANGQDFEGFEDDDDSDVEATQKLQALELPDEQMDEVGTKLDLAKAFVDMGDPEGARNILYEVLEEGNDSQKQEAQGLLDNLG